ncbi:hypothetical protein J2W35_006432 [Variovorax boronicumulans]|uniref:hypothetical protein n=1 Tax=Variovorax boronicumulans TaxID=436515 RepID=UPI00277FAB2E|nr:hypothetical protein [Variovorax boronicumulans]MDQ0086051.1 hypothetical protein [Variovorax boronicumulans]
MIWTLDHRQLKSVISPGLQGPASSVSPRAHRKTDRLSSGAPNIFIGDMYRIKSLASSQLVEVPTKVLAVAERR